MECERKNRWWRGCRFQPRYDRKFPPNLSKTGTSYPDSLEALKEQFYVADVCVTCGKVVKRGGNE